MDDLTVIMMTPNRVPESWALHHRAMLTKAIGDTPLITISAKPIDWGFNIPQEGYGLTNLFCCLLKGALLAETRFVATADDDTLYPASHYRWRPKRDDRFWYNLNRWHLLTWGDAFFFHKPRPGGGLLLARRELVVEALSARFRWAKGRQLGGRMVKELGTRPSLRKMDRLEWSGFFTTEPVVSFYHQGSVDDLCRRERKLAWPVRAFELPTWGRAEDLREVWK